MQDELFYLFLNSAIGTARILPTIFFLPFLKPSIIGGNLMRMTITLLIAMGLSPAYAISLNEWQALSFFATLTKEAIIGMLIGFAMALPFRTAMVLGELLDNQRGATISATMDPAVGVKASPMASFFNLFWSASFVVGGGLVLILQVIQESYRQFGITASISLNYELLSNVAGIVTKAVMHGFILASPMIIAMYLTEIALGLLAKFASQLNPFSISMSIKSIVMFSVLLIYFGPNIPGELFDMFDGTLLLNYLQ